MTEIQEAESLARQLTETIIGKKIAGVVAGLSFSDNFTIPRYFLSGNASPNLYLFIIGAI